MPSRLQALVVEDDADSRDVLAELVRSEGIHAEAAASLGEARTARAGREFDLLLLDLKLPDGAGTELLLGERAFRGDVIVITGHASADSALEALRSGATDYLVKPIDVQRLRTMLRHIRRRAELQAQVGELRGELRSLGHFGGLVGVSPSMQKVYDRVGRVAPTDAGVLLTGETGTGKELAARTLHDLSDRRAGPFVAVNCGAVASSLMESELFGHERGAFSGAERQHIGYFERADNGTLFLDELTEMSAELQVKILRVLETGRLVRVGGEREVPIDVRPIAATNRNPESAVVDGTLRQDLLYRLDVFRIELPPLRQRHGDIGLLARYFLAERCRAEEASKVLSADALAVLEKHDWPGNVRELLNVVYSSFVLADDIIGVDHLPRELRDGSGGTFDRLGIGVGMTLAASERALIEATLDSVDGHRERAAEMLGISTKTLYNRLREYREEPD